MLQSDCNLSFLQNLDWNEEKAISSVNHSKFYAANVLQNIDPTMNTINYFHPLSLTNKSNAEDNPSGTKPLAAWTRNLTLSLEKLSGQLWIDKTR